jgi:hypothetical protein
MDIATEEAKKNRRHGMQKPPNTINSMVFGGLFTAAHYLYQLFTIK